MRSPSDTTLQSEVLPGSESEAAALAALAAPESLTCFGDVVLPDGWSWLGDWRLTSERWEYFATEADVVAGTGGSVSMSESSSYRRRKHVRDAVKLAFHTKASAEAFALQTLIRLAFSQAEVDSLQRQLAEERTKVQ